MIGDNMLNNVDEQQLDKRGMVKLRRFSGSTINDLKLHYMIPLLRKRPSKVTIHIGTNDATKPGTSMDSVLNAMLDPKRHVEEINPRCERRHNFHCNEAIWQCLCQ